jgi:hypothetical protein
MNIIWGIILTLVSSIGWLGQLISAINPILAARLGLTELESDVDPAFYADVRGEAYWDAFTLWTLPAAGILLLLDNSIWVYFGLIGGGMFFYFAGRGILVRRVMQRKAIRIGSPENIKMAYIFLTLWGLTAIITIIMGLVNLTNS